METKFYLNGKKTTRKAIQERLGADRLAPDAEGSEKTSWLTR